MHGFEPRHDYETAQCTLNVSDNVCVVLGDLMTQESPKGDFDGSLHDPKTMSEVRPLGLHAVVVVQTQAQMAHLSFRLKVNCQWLQA